VAPPALVLLGPTAVGKSALAMELAAELGGEIVNADALQLYQGFDIGTGKPTAEERRRIPHHLLDLLRPEERLSAGEFARRARATVAAIQARDRLPLVVGGSGLYLRALLGGISPMPTVPASLRQWLQAAAARQGLPALRRWLRCLDPMGAARTREGDTQRTLRALEVVLTSGRPQGWWIAQQPFGDGGLPALRVGLTLPRAILYDRIAGRVSAMIADGWVGEVENILQAGLDPGLPAFQAIGYRQLARHLRGEIGLDRAVEDTIRATRRFAKRQLTWFRGEADVHWLDAREPSLLGLRVRELLQARDIGRAHGEARDQHPGRFPFPEPQGGP
jgi:tRNA dimethylallyltransferase